MKSLQIGSLFLVLLSGGGVVTPARAQTSAIAGTAAITTIINGLKGVVKQVEDSGHSLIEHGNVALGQQQVLMASTLSATLDKFAEAYRGSLSLTFDKLDVQTQNSFKSLEAVVKSADKIRFSSVVDAQNLIYKTQGAANQLLGTIPLLKRSPVYYGFTTRDILTAANAAAPSDIEILGFNLTDIALKFRKPQITVASIVVPDDKVAVEYDRVRVQLPEDLRKKVRLANTACDPIKTFPISVRVFYTEHSWLSKVSSWFDSEVVFTGQASPGNPTYEIAATFVGNSTTTASVSTPFRVSSGQLNVGCESTVSTSVQFTAPAGATQINPTAGWANTNNLDNVSQNAVSTGLTAIATGSIRGLNKNWVGDCRGGGHGELILSGSYMCPVTSTTPFALTSSATTTSEGSIVVPSADGLKLATVTIQFRRKGCAKLFDEVTFSIPDDANRNVQQTSKYGYFTIRYDRGNLAITGTNLLAN